MADKQSREENQCIHCGNQYREENSKPSFIKVCNECKQYRVSGGASFIRSKILEREIDYCRPLTPKQVDTVIELYKEYERTKPFSEVGKLLEESGDKMGASLLRLSVDVSEALKGLKALQREARSTTKALKELEGKKATMTIVDEMNGLCPKCNSHITTEDVYSLGCEQPLEQSCYCTECGWKRNV